MLKTINIQKALEFSKFFFNNPEIWFNQQNKYDFIINEKFKILLKDEVIEELIQYENCSSRFNIALILIFDQLPYYIYRNNTKIIRLYQSYIQDFANYLLENELQDYTPEEQCFIMMPIRHYNKSNPHILKSLIKKIIELRQIADYSIYKRFYKATLLALTNINNSLIKPINYTQPLNIYHKDYFKDILDTKSTFISMNDIIYTIDNKPKSLINIKRNELKHFYKSRNINKICVSFSGGVDSIVLLYLLKSIPEFDICAFHLNYGNRETAIKEAELCELFCRNLDIKLYIRNITEIKRQRDYDREIYEDITRRIRFGCYKHIQETGYIIALGHNRDDCLENIVSNITKQQKYENLSGMTSESTELDVLITRPFLSISKVDIYAIAEQCRLPHLYDSTPKWCERGMKRDILFPQLNEFDPRILLGLYELSKQLKSVLEIVNSDIKDNIDVLYNNENKLIGYIINNIKNEYHLRSILNIICKEAGMAYFSLKSIVNLWNEIESDKYKNGKKIWLNKNWYYSFINNVHSILSTCAERN
jgi:tRNA(Ile)-lysidine synthetase-like protein